MTLRVLIADADTYSLDYYREQMPHYGFEVETASGGVECLEKLREFSPDVLVLEPSLPWGSGDGVLARMHEDPGLPQVPVIVLTYPENRRELQRLVPFPVEDYQVKPLTAKRLAARVQAAAERRRREVPAPSRPAVTATQKVKP